MDVDPTALRACHESIIVSKYGASNAVAVALVPKLGIVGVLLCPKARCVEPL
jgi:hypothetical protein